MFRISITDTPSRRTLIVEGTLVGPWVAELGRTWRNASQDLDTRKLLIDLRNLTAISRDGEDAIFDLMKKGARSEEHTSELQSPDHLVCRLLLEKKKYLTKIVSSCKHN